MTDHDATKDAGDKLDTAGKNQKNGCYRVFMLGFNPIQLEYTPPSIGSINQIWDMYKWPPWEMHKVTALIL